MRYMFALKDGTAIGSDFGPANWTLDEIRLETNECDFDTISQLEKGEIHKDEQGDTWLCQLVMEVGDRIKYATTDTIMTANNLPYFLEFVNHNNGTFSAAKDGIVFHAYGTAESTLLAIGGLSINVEKVFRHALESGCAPVAIDL